MPSCFTGAVQELNEAVIVNPFDVEAAAAPIRAWREDFIGALSRCREPV